MASGPTPCRPAQGGPPLRCCRTGPPSGRTSLPPMSCPAPRSAAPSQGRTPPVIGHRNGTGGLAGDAIGRRRSDVGQPAMSVKQLPIRNIGRAARRGRRSGRPLPQQCPVHRLEVVDRRMDRDRAPCGPRAVCRPRPEDRRPPAARRGTSDASEHQASPVRHADDRTDAELLHDRLLHRDSLSPHGTTAGQQRDHHGDDCLTRHHVDSSRDDRRSRGEPAVP